MGSGGKGGSSDGGGVSQADAYSAGRAHKENYPHLTGLEGLDTSREGYADFEAGYMSRYNERVQEESMRQMMEAMAEGNAQQSYDYAEAQREAMAASRLSGLLGKRDAMINNYFDAANSATSYVSDKIAAEKANAAMMGVDYNMNDEIKSERISNYFGSIWSEGSQAELESSFGEVGAGDFEQTLWRGEGVEAGPAGSVGSSQTGGGIKAKAPGRKTLIDEENQLGAQSILGAS